MIDPYDKPAIAALLASLPPFNARAMCPKCRSIDISVSFTPAHDRAWGDKHVRYLGVATSLAPFAYMARTCKRCGFAWAERLADYGVGRTDGGGGGGSGMPHGVGGFTGSVILDATKPTPDYRAALEALVESGSDLDEQLTGLESTLQDGAFNALHDLRAALTHARKVLHGQ